MKKLRFLLTNANNLSVSMMETSKRGNKEIGISIQSIEFVDKKRVSIEYNSS